MDSVLIAADTRAEFVTRERCAILELSNDAGDPAVSIARARVAPGITTAWHKLISTTERYVILAGRGDIELADRSATPMVSGDCVRIPAGMAQRITNTGETDLLFYAICTPRFTPECYIALE